MTCHDNASMLVGFLATAFLLYILAVISCHSPCEFPPKVPCVQTLPYYIPSYWIAIWIGCDTTASNKATSRSICTSLIDIMSQVIMSPGDTDHFALLHESCSIWPSETNKKKQTKTQDKLPQNRGKYILEPSCSPPGAPCIPNKKKKLPYERSREVSVLKHPTTARAS